MNNQNFEILKSDSDRKLVFGWASVAITVNGEQLEDRQQDIIDPDDLEEAAYEYVLNFRDTGEEHIPTMRKKGKLVESCVLTAEKQKAMGIPEGAVPVGWWIGFKIEDDAAWERVKSGQYRMFSIEGKANRIPVEKSRSSYDEYKPVAKTFEDVLKFNPYHDSKGRFASANSATSFTWRPGASKMHDKAIAGEKDRTHRSDFHDKIKGLILTSYTYNPQEMPQMLIGIGKEVAKEIDSRFKAKKKAGETTEDEPQTEDIYDVLRDVRSFGPGEYANKVFNSSDLDDKRTKAIMDDALGRYPTDWYADAIFDCGVDIRDTDGRAFHYVGYDSTSQIKVYAKESPELVKQLDLKSDSITNLGIANQLAHEMGHYFERSNTDVGNAARAYYDKRTKSSELTEMYPGEYTKKDHFADEYMGKYYTSGSTEITSVLVQKLGYLDPKKSITQDLFSNQKKDIQSYNFVLGLLAGGGTKWEE